MKSRQEIAAIPDDVKKILNEIAKRLEAHSNGKNLERHQAAADSLTLRRIVEPISPQYTAAEQLEMMAAISYAIRKELFGRGNAKKAGAATAKKLGINERTVNTYSSRWIKDMPALIERMVTAAARRGEIDPRRRDKTRAELLEQELADLESIDVPRRSRPKHQSRVGRKVKRTSLFLV